MTQPPGTGDLPGHSATVSLWRGPDAAAQRRSALDVALRTWEARRRRSEQTGAHGLESSPEYLSAAPSGTQPGSAQAFVIGGVIGTVPGLSGGCSA